MGKKRDLALVSVLNALGLPVGNYIFIFGVDMTVNGKLDSDQLYYDNVNVEILPDR